MPNLFKTFFSFFQVDVREEKGKIFVTGASGSDRIVQLINRLYESKRITNNMFIKVSRSGFILDSFFALEFFYILNELQKNRKPNNNLRLVAEIAQKLKLNTWLKNIDNDDIPDRLNFKLLNDLTMEPLGFQLDFMKKFSKIDRQYNLKGMLLAATAGSGKTFTTLAIAHMMQSEHVIIVCPKNAVFNVWQETIVRIFKKAQTFWCYASGQPYNNQRFLIFHYEGLEKAIEIVKNLPKINTTIILDESHNLNEMVSLRTQRFNDLCSLSGSKSIIYASGTSFKASALESVPLLRSIDPLFTEDVERSFKLMFKGDAEKATEVLANRINAVSFKVEKSQLNLTSPIFKEIKVKMPTADKFTLESIAMDMAVYIQDKTLLYKKRYESDKKFFDECCQRALGARLAEVFNPMKRREIEREHIQYLSTIDRIVRMGGGGSFGALSEEIMFCNKYEREKVIPYLPTREDKVRFKDVKSCIKYVKLKIQGECLGNVLGRARIDAHVEMSKYIDYDSILNSTLKKTVVFTTFVEVVEQCRKSLLEQGKNPLVAYSKMDTTLESVVARFGSDTSANPLVATYASLSTAVPLIMADTMILINVPFRNYVLEQAVSRIHRLGQDSQTMVYTIVLDTGEKPNISSRNIDILKWSQEQVEKILQIESPFKIDESEEINQAIESIGLEEFTEWNMRPLINTSSSLSSSW